MSQSRSALAWSRAYLATPVKSAGRRGPLELNYEKLLIPGSDMQTLITYHAEPRSDSEERLRLLASITTPNPAPSTATRPTPGS